MLSLTFLLTHSIFTRGFLVPRLVNLFNWLLYFLNFKVLLALILLYLEQDVNIT